MIIQLWLNVIRKNIINRFIDRQKKIMLEKLNFLKTLNLMISIKSIETKNLKKKKF